MIGLWVAFAVLLVLAICFICWPLLPFSRRKHFATTGHQQENIDIFRDRLHELEQEKTQGNLKQETFFKLKRELEKNLLQDTDIKENNMLTPVEISGKHWMFALSLVIAVTVVSLGMYFNLGRSDDLLISQAMAKETETGAQQAGSSQPPNMEKAIELLEAKLAQDPDNKEKQYLLVNSYAVVGQFDKASKLYAKLAENAEPGSEEFARLKGAQAQSLFQASSERMTPDIQNLVDTALKVDAQEPSSLMLQGINAYNSSNYQQAIDFWEKAKVKAGEDQTARFIEPAIMSAQQKMGIAVAPKEVKQTQPVAGKASLIIDLTLDKALKEKVSENDVVFVFARPVGGRMPLAAERIQVKDLPAQIVLDDSKAAMPTAKLSSVDVVEVTARVSLSGKPMAQKGDLFAEVKNIAVKDSVSLTLDINQVVK